MRKAVRSLVVPVFAVLILGLGSAAADPPPVLVLQDTFEDDTVSTPPNGPEIGSATYLGGADYEVVGIGGGGKLLQCDDDATSEQIAIRYTPSSTPDIAEVSFEFMIQGGATMPDLYPFTQQLDWDGNTTALKLYWGNDGLLRLLEVHGSTPVLLTDTTFNWSTAVTHDVLILTDATADRVDVQVNSTPVVTNYVLGQDVSVLTGLYMSSTTNTLGVMRLDNVQITPEPATMALLAFGGAALLKRRRRR